jgi:RHH-type transcriptional regulator, rel operon repressor / antitoxin RelB
MCYIRYWENRPMKQAVSSGTSVVRISKTLDRKLDALAARTGRKKSYYASKAIAAYLEDLEDYLAAKQALKKTKRSYSLEELARELGMDY